MVQNSFGIKDAPPHIRAMHKAILERTGIDHAVETLEKALLAALSDISVEDLLRVIGKSGNSNFSINAGTVPAKDFTDIDVAAILGAINKDVIINLSCPSSVAGNIDPDFEEALDQIRNWPISRSYILLFEFIKHQVWRHSFGQLSASTVDDGAVEYIFTTGGWSENEEILEALKQQKLAWALTWQRSECGGKHVFKLVK